MSRVAYMTRRNIPCVHSFRETYCVNEQDKIGTLGIKLSMSSVSDNGSCNEGISRRKHASARKLESVFPLHLN
jgi:hypothetical protein